VRGKVVVITGGSSGIGLAAAERCVSAGARVIIVARDPEKLEAARAQLADRGEVHTYACDIADYAACDGFAKAILDQFGAVDVLVNNAGRSIRRSIDLSYDRFHDFERTMQLNYFAAIRLTMALLPSMLERGNGHVVNISSIGVLSNAPRFSGYVASKAALEAWTRCAAAEFADRGVTFTIINMPLVRTPMIAPTKIYDQMPVATPDEAADMVVEAIIARPKRIATRLGLFSEVFYLAAPRISEVVMNTAYKMFPDSSAAKGEVQDKPKDSRPTPEAAIFASLLRGVHW
jgi:NAD(P)-dependent dehydrogenase (short-subunit alcohol dehydrogenase family)